MFVMAEKNSIPYLQADIFKDCDFLTHAFCTRHGGSSKEDYKSLNMSFREGDDEYNVLQNWGRLAEAFGIALEKFLVVNQVHGDGIFVIKKHGTYLSSENELRYDAIITDRPGLAIGIKTADCVPVFIVDKVKKVIAAVHAGWRGSALAICVKVIEFMKIRYNSRPQDILAAIGPSIGRCCYQVDSVVADSFSGHRNKSTFIFSDARPGRWLLDLVEANRRQILDCGIPERNIEISDFCTSCRKDLFFSHRASGGITGRQLNFMMIKSEKPDKLATLDSKNYWRE